MPEPIEGALRTEDMDAGELVVRGNPLTIERLLDHAQRTAKIFTWRNEALYAISAAVTGPGRSVNDLLRTVNLRTRSTYASAAVSTVTSAGFHVLPTFAAPHVSIVWPKYDEQTAETLVAVLGTVRQNPYRERGVSVTVRVTIPADVQQVDETGFVWTLLVEAAEPSRVVPGKVIVAGDTEEPFLARVVDIVERSGHQVVHLEVLGVPDEVVDELRHANVLSA